MPALSKLVSICLASAALLAVFASAASAAVGDLDLVSWPGEPTLSSHPGHSATEPSISDDGRYVAYKLTYFADTPGSCCTDATNIVVRDLVTGEVEVASRAAGVDGEIGDRDSANPAISGNGRYVVFESDSRNLLGPAHPTLGYGIFRKDLQTGEVKTVVVGQWGQRDPDISDDGRWVSYTGRYNNSDDDSTYVMDMNDGSYEAVSRGNGAGDTQSGFFSGLSSISGDGSTISFFSFNSFDAHGVGGTYVRNRVAQTTEMVSLGDGAAGTPFDPVSARPSSLSTNGRIVAFGGYPSGWIDGVGWPPSQIYVRNRDTDTTELVSRPTGADTDQFENGGMNPSISGDGRYVAFDVDGHEVRDLSTDEWQRAIVVRDTLLDTTTEISVNAAPEALEPDGTASTPMITADGTYAVFRSNSSTISIDDDPLFGNIFRKDLLGGATASSTGPTLPGPKHVDPPEEEEEEPEVPYEPPVDQQPRVIPPAVLNGFLAGEQTRRLLRNLAVKVVCTPRPCSVTPRSQVLRINGRSAGKLRFTGKTSPSPSLNKFGFTLTKKQYEQARKALKKRKSVKVDFSFYVLGIAQTTTIEIPIKLKR